MPSSFFICALGVCIEIEVDPRLSQVEAKRIAEAWADAAIQPDTAVADARITVTVGSTAAADAGLFDVAASRMQDALAQLSTKVTLAAIELRKAQLVMLHACGVATERGDVVAFVGPSGRGKTTLASSLGRKFGYVTDETIGVTPNNEVLPYRKPLSRVSSAGPKEQLAPSTLGLRPVPDAPLRVASIVLIDRRADYGGSPRSEAVGLAEALPLLVPELSYLPALERPLERLAALIAATGGVKRLVYGEADSVDEEVLEELLSLSHKDDWQRLVWSAADTPSGGRFAQVPPTDGLVIGSRLVLLHEATVRVLDGIGPSIWTATRSSATLDDICSFVVRQHGSPSDGTVRERVSAAVEALVQAGVLRRG